MLDIYTVAFFGHRYIDNPFRIEDRLEEEIRRLLSEHEYVDFLVGRDGEFDQVASSAVLRVLLRPAVRSRCCAPTAFSTGDLSSPRAFLRRQVLPRERLRRTDFRQAKFVPPEPRPKTLPTT